MTTVQDCWSVFTCRFHIVSQLRPTRCTGVLQSPENEHVTLLRSLSTELNMLKIKLYFQPDYISCNDINLAENFILFVCLSFLEIFNIKIAHFDMCFLTKEVIFDDNCYTVIS